MKYVKLFESWLNTINEDLQPKFENEARKYQLDAEEQYANNRELFGKHLIKLAKQMAPQEEKINQLNSKVQGKNIILSTSGGENEKFTFSYDKTGDFSTISTVRLSKLPNVSNSINMLAIQGKCNVSNSYSDETSVAEFLYSLVTGEKLGEEGFETAAEHLLQMSMGKKPKISGKKGEETVSKMTIEDFNSLTKQQVLSVLKQLLKVDGKDVFSIAQGKDPDFFFINLNRLYAQSEGIKFSPYDDGGAGDYGGRHFVMQIESSGTGVKENDPVSKCKVYYGVTVDRDSTDFTGVTTAARTTQTNSSSSTYLDMETTTLASVIMGIREFVKGGMNTKKGKKIANSADFLTAVVDEIKKTSPEGASDAWIKGSGPTNISVKPEKEG